MSAIAADKDRAQVLIERRRSAMAVLAESAAADIADCMARLTLPAHDMLRPSESGLVMLRGRVGGDGAPFNLGEAAVSRSAVRIAGGVVGLGYVLGRDKQKATMIALCDAMVQSADHADDLQAHVIAPLSEKIAARRERQAAETAATRVDFYTLVRGEG